MGKIDDALAVIRSQEDTTERALLLAGVISTLMRIRGVELVMVGDLAYDCYVNNTNSGAELTMCLLKGRISPRLIREVMAEELHADGRLWNWEVADVSVRIGGQAITAAPDLCRDFKTEFGVARLIPAEELVAERLLAAVYPAPDVDARAEARRVLALALAEVFAMDWEVLEKLCASGNYQVAADLEQLKVEAQAEVDAAVAEAASKEEDEADAVEAVPVEEFQTGDAYEPVAEAATVTGLRTDSGRLVPPPKIVPPTKRETQRLPAKGAVAASEDF